MILFIVVSHSSLFNDSMKGNATVDTIFLSVYLGNCRDKLNERLFSPPFHRKGHKIITLTKGSETDTVHHYLNTYVYWNGNEKRKEKFMGAKTRFVPF